MKLRHWLLSILIAIAFVIGSIFFFFGSLMKLASGELNKEKGNIAVIEIVGELMDPKDISDELRKAKEDTQAKAVILRIDSPGGSVGAAQEIYETVKELKTAKPVVVSMGSLAASGGYYVAAPATKIIANEGTVTGSIGVIMELMNVEELFAWAKLKPLTLKSGKFKDVGSPTREMTPEEKEYLENIIHSMHAQFKKAVASHRKLTEAEIDSIADGRVFTGEEALKLKLVDELGGLDKAVKAASDLAQIKEEPKIYYIKKDQTFVEALTEGVANQLEFRLGTMLKKTATKYRFSYSLP